MIVTQIEVVQIVICDVSIAHEFCSGDLAFSLACLHDSTVVLKSPVQRNFENPEIQNIAKIIPFNFYKTSKFKSQSFVVGVFISWCVYLHEKAVLASLGFFSFVFSL